MSGSALFPLFTQGAFGSEFALFVQILIGIGFGFALERGGFARAENLVVEIEQRVSQMLARWKPREAGSA